MLALIPQFNCFTLVLLIMPLAVLGCSGTNFNSQNPTKREQQKNNEGKKNPPGVRQGDDQGTDLEDPGSDAGVDSEESGGDQAANPQTESARCIASSLPLRIQFVLDITFSMNASVNAIKSNIGTFVSNLKAQSTNKSVDVGVGLIAFKDGPSIREEIPFTSDVARFGQQMNSVYAESQPSDRDTPEEGLTAFSKGLNNLSGQGNSVKAIIIITDNYAHQGGPTEARNYDLSNILGALTQPAFKYLYIYDATPDQRPPDIDRFPGQSVPPNHPTPAAQWQEVRQAAQQAQGSANAQGRALGFPFTANAILNDIPNDLIKSVNICN